MELEFKNKKGGAWPSNIGAVAAFLEIIHLISRACILSFSSTTLPLSLPDPFLHIILNFCQQS